MQSSVCLALWLFTHLQWRHNKLHQQHQSTSTSAPAASQAAPATPAEPAKVKLKEGTDVNLKLAQALSSKTATAGDSVELVLDQDLIVDNALVAKKGSRALATVSNAKKAGMAGKGGELNLRLEYLKAGDTKVNCAVLKPRMAIIKQERPSGWSLPSVHWDS